MYSRSLRVYRMLLRIIELIFGGALPSLAASIEAILSALEHRNVHLAGTSPVESFSLPT